MNDLRKKIADPPLVYQTERLQTLLNEIRHCCQDRMIFESNKFNLPQAELKCLMLFRGERYLTVKGLAQKMDVAKSRITIIISGLAKKGLVQIIADPKDRRIKLISLSPKGQYKTEKINGFIKSAHEEILLQMKPSERKNILSSLEFLRACMEIVKAQLE